MTNRWKLWVGASALAMMSGALPAAQIVSPATMAMFGFDLANEANAQEGEESGEGEGTTAECTTETGEGEEGGTTECAPTGEEGEGEGEGG